MRNVNNVTEKMSDEFNEKRKKKKKYKSHPININIQLNLSFLKCQALLSFTSYNDNPSTVNSLEIFYVAKKAVSYLMHVHDNGNYSHSIRQW